MEHPPHALLQRHLSRGHAQRGIIRCFKGILRAGHALHLTAVRLGIEALHIALHADLHGAVHVDEPEPVAEDPANHVTVPLLRRHEGTDDRLSLFCMAQGKACRAPQVLRAVFIRESEILAQSRAQFITIKDLTGDAALLE